MLPKIDVPIYDLVLPLSKKKIKYRPFLVKEEKILMMAMESEDDDSVLNAIKQIANNCSLSDIDVEDMATADLEYYFLHLRARSVGEVAELQYKCNNKVKDDAGEEKTCNHLVKFDVNIFDIEPKINPEHTNKIELSADLGVVMRYPSLKIIADSEENTDTEKMMKILIACVDYIYDKDNIYYRKDIEESELVEFIDSMSREQFMKVQAFFDTMPKLTKELNFKCGKCGYTEKIEVEGIQNFFG
jgi:hypothetical protein